MPYLLKHRWLYALLCLAWGCDDDPRAPQAAGDAGVSDAGAESDASDDASAPVFVSCEKMDVLFVIDNSTSMQEEQANLSDNLDSFVDALEAYRDGGVDFRIGVTTMDFPLAPYLAETDGQAGNLLQTVDMEKPWLTRGEPNLKERFRELATVGTSGNWNEQPLKALLSALEGPAAEDKNAGFLRDDALLAAVIITDEDDVSMQSTGNLGPTPVSYFIERLDALKQSRAFWAASVMAGGTAPTCSSSFGDALFAARLQAFAEQAGAGVVFSSICEGDLSIGLNAALETFARVCDLLIY